MKNTKTIGFILGIIIIAFSFLTVFGKDLQNLSVKDDDTAGVEVKPTPGDPSTLKPGTNSSNGGSTTTTKPTTKPTTSGTGTTTGPKTYSLGDISTHKSATSCWSAINGGVYDLTDWVDNHPGGRMAILMICGKDGSALFNMQHGGSSRVGNILASFKIGNLK